LEVSMSLDGYVTSGGCRDVLRSGRS
jgi:hypothetical protein